MELMLNLSDVKKGIFIVARDEYEEMNKQTTRKATCFFQRTITSVNDRKNEALFHLIIQFFKFKITYYCLQDQGGRLILP